MSYKNNNKTNHIDNKTNNTFLVVVFSFFLLSIFFSYISKTIEIHNINNNPKTSIVKLNVEKTRIDFIKEGYETKMRTEDVFIIVSKEGCYVFHKKNSFWFDENNAFLINNMYLCSSKTLTRDCLIRHDNNLSKDESK